MDRLALSKKRSLIGGALFIMYCRVVIYIRVPIHGSLQHVSWLSGVVFCVSIWFFGVGFCTAAWCRFLTPDAMLHVKLILQPDRPVCLLRCWCSPEW